MEVPGAARLSALPVGMVSAVGELMGSLCSPSKIQFSCCPSPALVRAAAHHLCVCLFSLDS